MADDPAVAAGKAIDDAYSRAGSTGVSAAPLVDPQVSAGKAIDDAYRTQTANQPPAAKNWQDEYFPAPTQAQLGDIVPQADNPISRIIRAGAEGAEAVPYIPRVPGDYITAPFYNPLLAGVETAFRAGGALLRGGQQAVVEATPDIHLGSVPAIPLGGGRFISGELTPGSLGREIAASPEAFPTGFNALRVPGRPPIPEAPPPGPRFVSELTAPPRPPGMTDAARINQLVEHAVNEEQPAVGPPMARGPATQEAPAPPPPAGGAQPAGAQITPAAASGLTPEQEAAAGSAADKQWFYKTITPGEANRAEYIKGITPTMAQAEQTVNAARDSKVLRQLSADAEQNERALLSEHSDIRKNEFGDIAGSDVTQEADMKRASDQIDQDLSAAYAHGGTVDLQPVVDAAKGELSGSAGKLPPVKSAMKQIMDAAQKDDGTGLETDPRQANAVRRVIIYMQSKQGRLENPGYGSPDVVAALTRVKDQLSKQIEPAAPGFTKANADYAAARQAADAREALQAYEPKLYDQFGHMKFSPFHRMMGDIIKSRDPNAPLNPYSALTEDQMGRLKSIHDDLQRVASAEDLAGAAGSDTAPNLAAMARRAVRGGASSLIGAGAGFAVGHILGHEAGMATGMFTKSAVDKLFSDQAVRQATAEHNALLRPDATKYPLTPNPLRQPPP